MPTTGDLARALRRRVAPPRRRQIRHRRQRRHRSRQCRRAVLGDVLPRQSGLDMQILPHRDQGHGPRSQRNGGEDALGADRRDAQGGLSAGLAAQARIHGARQGDLGRARPAAAAPEAPWFGYSLGRMGRRVRRGGASARSRATISRPARSWPSAGARMCAINTEVARRGSNRPRQGKVRREGRGDGGARRVREGGRRRAPVNVGRQQALPGYVGGTGPPAGANADGPVPDRRRYGERRRSNLDLP